MICCCSLAGTGACRTCFNNPDAKVKPVIQYWCNYCDSVLTPHQKYCHNCGREIDWSEIFKDE